MIQDYPEIVSESASMTFQELLADVQTTNQEAAESFHRRLALVERVKATLRWLVDPEQDPLNRALRMLMLADTPSELRRVISQYPALLDDESLGRLAELINKYEQDGNTVLSQVLRLRYDEIERIRRQGNPNASSTPFRSLDHNELERVAIYTESSGVAVNPMFGDIAQMKSSTPLAKQWQPPGHRSLHKTFVGRQQELQTLLRHLATGENVAITGQKKATMPHSMGGIGKTYLALKLATELEGRFPDGIIWVDLGPQVIDEASAQLQLGRLVSYTFGSVPPSDRLHPEQVAT